MRSGILNLKRNSVFLKIRNMMSPQMTRFFKIDSKGLNAKCSPKQLQFAMSGMKIARYARNTVKTSKSPTEILRISREKMFTSNNNPIINSELIRILAAMVDQKKPAISRLYIKSSKCSIGKSLVKAENRNIKPTNVLIICINIFPNFNDKKKGIYHINKCLF